MNNDIKTRIKFLSDNNFANLPQDNSLWMSNCYYLMKDVSTTTSRKMKNNKYNKNYIQLSFNLVGKTLAIHIMYYLQRGYCK